MNSTAKICPRCQAQLQPGNGAFELVKKGITGANYSPGLSVALYFCSGCGYIELYDLKVVSRI